MTAVPAFSAAPMEGDGFYNRNSTMQAGGIGLALALWEQAAAAVPVGDEPLVIADYAASQGKNSMAPVKIAILALRAKAGADRPVEVIHTDLPTNDFASLFTALDADPESYMAGATGIFPSAVGRSYFEPILPPGRVHLAWNSWSVQWLSQAVLAPDHVFATFSSDPAVMDALAARKAQDWQRFLVARATEMRTGGRMLCVAPALGGSGWRWLGGTLWAGVEEMGREGLLSPEERLRITIPTAPRTEDEFRAPFTGGAAHHGLVLEHFAIHAGVDPFWAVYQDDGDAAGLAHSLSGMMRAFSGPTIIAAIDPARDRAALVDDLFVRFIMRLAASPQPHDHRLAIMVLAKRG